jgi:hypothetical protein
MSNMDHQFDEAVTGGPVRISAHPAFPAIVAAWFAALFGFGVMLLPGAMVDGFAGALNLGAVSDSFVLPIDFMGRSILAVLAGMLGGVGGWALARRVAAPQARAPEPRTLDISELDGEAPIRQGDDQDAPRKRRRSLAVAEDGTSSVYPEPAIPPAPMPAERLAFDPPPAPVVGVDSDLADSVAGMDRHPTSESTESADLAQREEAAVDRASGPATVNGDEPDASRAAETHDMVDIGGWNDDEAEAVLFAEEISESPEAPSAFSAPSLSRESHMNETSTCKVPAPMRNDVNGREHFLSQIADAELENLGTVQLAERLAISIARRRECAAALAAQAPLEAPSQPFQPFQPLPSVPVRSDHSATATAFESAPEALRPIRFDFDPEEGEEEDLGLSLDTIRHSPGSPLAVRQPRPPLFGDDDGEAETFFVDPDLEEDEPEDPGENYGSLLATRRELDPGGEHVCINEPEPEFGDIEPAAIFSGQSRHSDSAAAEAPPVAQFPSPSLRRFDPPAAPVESEEAATKASATSASSDRVEAERSLRGALEALQRVGSVG